MAYRNGQPIPNSIGEKIFNACFFLVHYGGFQAAYAVMIWNAHNVFGRSFDPPQLLPIYMSAGIFFVNHLFSLVYHFKEVFKNQEVGKLMSIPYIRIIPMHLIVILMAIIPSPLIAFLLLRMVADVAMHAVEHYNPQGTII
jgi:hypothetical protein